MIPPADRPPVRAVVPGHATGFFTVERDDDPIATGSRGAGIALASGVEVTVDGEDGGDGGVLEGGDDGTADRKAPAAESTVTVDGSPATIEAVEEVIDRLGIVASVRIETALPIGAGFGVSGAAALGTALAADTFGAGFAVDAFGPEFATDALGNERQSENSRSDRSWSDDVSPDDRATARRSTAELVRIAHRAEVEAGTGLGDVVAQARGGVPIRLEPGAPPHSRLDDLPARARIEYLTLGGLSTGSVLSGETATLSAAGERALETFRDRLSLDSFFRESRRFADEAGLLDDEVAAIVESVLEAGGEATMAMLGRTVIAPGTGLSDAGYDPEVTAIDPCGARLEPVGDGDQDASP